MLVQLRAQVHRRGLDRVKQQLGHARLLDIDQVWLEHALGPLEALRGDLDHSPVRQLRHIFKSAGLAFGQIAQKRSQTV